MSRQRRPARLVEQLFQRPDRPRLRAAHPLAEYQPCLLNDFAAPPPVDIIPATRDTGCLLLRRVRPDASVSESFIGWSGARQKVLQATGPEAQGWNVQRERLQDSS